MHITSRRREAHHAHGGTDRPDTEWEERKDGPSVTMDAALVGVCEPKNAFLLLHTTPHAASLTEWRKTVQIKWAINWIEHDSFRYYSFLAACILGFLGSIKANSS